MHRLAAASALVLWTGLCWGQDPWELQGARGCWQAKVAARPPEEPGGGPDGAPGRDGLAGQTDVLHYDLELEVRPATSWLGGSNLMTVRSTVDGLSGFRFGLRESFTITEVRSSGVAAAWTRLDAVLVEVTLDRAYDAGEVFTVYVAYEGVAAGQGSWGSIRFRNRGGAAEVWTLSQPWWAHTWWPCKDDNTDKATADLRFIVPEGMVVASNGVLLSVEDYGVGQQRHHWRTLYPTAPYLFCFAATNYHRFGATWDHAGGSLPLEFFIYPEHDTPPTQQALLEVRTMLDVFSALYGPYPFPAEKYGIYEFGFGGGMEHQTMTGQGSASTALTAHELSHQWWGDSVTCATWHDIWLNEGFATYSEALYFEHLPGSPGEPWLHLVMQYYTPQLSGETLYVYDISSMDRVFSYNTTYLKGAWVLHMLRHVVGTQAFFDILAAWRAAYEGSAATTADFESVAEAVTGRELSWFFAQWVYGARWPYYYHAWRQHVLDGQRYVELYIRQHPFYPTFTMPIDVRTTGGGAHELHVIWNDHAEEHFLLPVAAGPVESLELDPTPWMLRTIATTGFVEGPPKVVRTTPAPGSRVPLTGSVEVVFHTDVNLPDEALQLAGLRSGPQPVTVAYDPARHAATLTFAGPPLPDAYTLTVADSVTGLAGGKPLDGELADPGSPASLPSGDGRPGGAAVVRFALLPPPGDLNCDAVVGVDDVDAFVMALWPGGAYEAAYPGCDRMAADVNADGRVDFADIDAFLTLLEG